MTISPKYRMRVKWEIKRDILYNIIYTLPELMPFFHLKLI